MDFLKTIMNEISGDNSSEIGNLTKTLLSNNGDKGVLLDTVVNTIKEKGMEDNVESWIGTGDNKAISANQLPQGKAEGNNGSLVSTGLGLLKGFL
jgi:uncharacterized protein YidB (DUF937 family)